MNEFKDKILNSIFKLDSWIECNGWSGYDPYDIKSLKWIRKIIELSNNNYALVVIREIIFEIFYSFPMISRKLTKIKPQINNKGMALLARGYLDLYRVTQKNDFLEKSKFCIDFLIKNANKKYSGFGWGYPFDWQSTSLIPKNTPNGIVSTAVGDAFWSLYEFTNEQKYLSLCKEICTFLINLPIDYIKKDQICFSYAPSAINHIHNLNLFIAEFLIKVGQEVNNGEWVDLGLKAVNYTVNNQLSNGSFDYNGPPEKPYNFIDNYHTGFILRMLHNIWKLTENQEIYMCLEKCYKHYIDNFFEDGKIPKLHPNRKYPVDIHSCAESINCLTQLKQTFPEGYKIAQNISIWTIENLQDETGYFYYGIRKSRFIRKSYVSKVAYLRWGQSWMLKALSNLLVEEHESNDLE
ncbi:MAG: hypothetical protein Q7J16_11075 [Candidatus Cloacimonadales bacterium]|nr:hypothetical protein [Candidatus Cloacimonadales bacterium]